MVMPYKVLILSSNVAFVVFLDICVSFMVFMVSQARMTQQYSVFSLKGFHKDPSYMMAVEILKKSK